MKAQLQQAQQIIEQSQNQLAEAEAVRARASLIEAQGKAGLEAAKITENARQFDDSQEQDQLQNDQKLAFDLTKLEADTGKNIPGSAI